MNRRSLIRSLGAACLSPLSRVATDATGRAPEQHITFARDELRKMYNNKLRLARPDAVCPLPDSSTVKLRYTFRYRHYQEVTGADTWLTSWASDGNLYSTYADGNVAGEDGRPVQVICTLQGNDWYFRQLGVHCPLESTGTAENPPRFVHTREINHPT